MPLAVSDPLMRTTTVPGFAPFDTSGTATVGGTMSPHRYVPQSEVLPEVSIACTAKHDVVSMRVRHRPELASVVVRALVGAENFLLGYRRCMRRTLNRR